MPKDQNPSLGIILFGFLVKKHVFCNGKQNPSDVNDDLSVSSGH